jgi:hypothetical protein
MKGTLRIKNAGHETMLTASNANVFAWELKSRDAWPSDFVLRCKVRGIEDDIHANILGMQIHIQKLPNQMDLLRGSWCKAYSVFPSAGLVEC